MSSTSLRKLGLLLGNGAALLGSASAFPYNTFDGPGFPACNDVAAVYNVTSIDEMVSIVKDAAANGTPVRASGKGHSMLKSRDIHSPIVKSSLPLLFNVLPSRPS